MGMSNELKEALELVQECLDDWPYAATRVIPIMCRLEKVKELLLKEQEAVKPKKADNPEESEYCCGICGYPLWLDEFYCAHCGRRIEWEGR